MYSLPPKSSYSRHAPLPTPPPQSPSPPPPRYNAFSPLLPRRRPTNHILERSSALKNLVFLLGFAAENSIPISRFSFPLIPHSSGENRWTKFSLRQKGAQGRDKKWCLQTETRQDKTKLRIPLRDGRCGFFSFDRSDT